MDDSGKKTQKHIRRRKSAIPVYSQEIEIQGLRCKNVLFKKFRVYQNENFSQ